jgi:hypothetical protein
MLVRRYFIKYTIIVQMFKVARNSKLLRFYLHIEQGHTVVAFFADSMKEKDQRDRFYEQGLTKSGACNA